MIRDENAMYGKRGNLEEKEIDPKEKMDQRGKAKEIECEK